MEPSQDNNQEREERAEPAKDAEAQQANPKADDDISELKTPADTYRDAFYRSSRYS